MKKRKNMSEVKLFCGGVPLKLGIFSTSHCILARLSFSVTICSRLLLLSSREYHCPTDVFGSLN